MIAYVAINLINPMYITISYMENFLATIHLIVIDCSVAMCIITFGYQVHLMNIVIL